MYKSLNTLMEMLLTKMRVNFKIIGILCLACTCFTVLYVVQISFTHFSYLDGRYNSHIYQYKQNYAAQLPLKGIHYLCSPGKGGLGNQMFQYAAIYGIAKVKGMVPLLNDDVELRKYFDIWAVHETKDGRICQDMKQYKEKRSSAFDLETISFSDKWDTKLGGYLQTFRYFTHVEERIRQQFQLPTTTVQRAKQILDESIRSFHLPSDDPPTLVAIHVRRGDRVREVNVKLGMTVATKEYIIHAKNYFLDKYKNVIFVVCSDTIGWCRYNMDSSRTIFMEKNSQVIDMAIMLQCSHTIMTVGTFGWWVSWLVNGDTIYYQKRFQPNSPLARHWNMSDHYPPHWIAML